MFEILRYGKHHDDNGPLYFKVVAKFEAFNPPSAVEKFIEGREADLVDGETLLVRFIRDYAPGDRDGGITAFQILPAHSRVEKREFTPGITGV